MLNTAVKLTTNVQLNTPASGIIQKSHPKSVMRYLQQGSELAKLFFNENPHRRVGTDYKKVPIIILQVLLMSESYMLVEYVDEKDF